MRPGVYVKIAQAEPRAGRDLPPPQAPRVYTAAEFEAMVGSRPTDDDLDRLNCQDTESPGHLQCGVCILHEVPRFICGCVAPRNLESEPMPAVQVRGERSRVAVEFGRIQGWPELSSFPWLMERLNTYKFESNEPKLLQALEQEVRRLLCELIQRGALRRDFRGAWCYDGRGR